MNFSGFFDFASKVWSELKDKPATGVILVALVAASFINWQAISGLKAAQLTNASARDVAELVRSQNELKLTVKKAGFETQLQQTNSEIFRLERAKEEMYKTGQTPDRLYDQRIAELQGDKDSLSFELDSTQHSLDALNKP